MVSSRIFKIVITLEEHFDVLKKNKKTEAVPKTSGRNSHEKR